MASPSTPRTAASSESNNTRARRDRPCDACRKRKSRCVLPEGAEVCVLCAFHKQECSFVRSPQPRKRKLNSDASKDERVTAKESTERDRRDSEARRTSQSNPKVRNIDPPVDDYADLKGPSLLKKTLGLQHHRHSRHIGLSSEFEPCLVDLHQFDRKDESAIPRGALRKVTNHDTFLMSADRGTQNYEDEINDLDAIEAIIAPHGRALIDLYFRIVHPSFPILHKKVYLEKYDRTHREFSPPLLAAVYILALNWWSYSSDLASLPKPNGLELERLARKTINDVIHRPKLSTVQAGLLLLQRSEEDSWALSAQLVAIGHTLGLHLDPATWKIPSWERGLRKRLAWALYMQDKWSALIYGRPSHIQPCNWAVGPVTEEDFPETAVDEDDADGSSEVEKGRALFIQMIALSQILAEILDAFYTLQASHEISGAADDGIHLILQRAKPVQLRLKEWFASLPPQLKMGPSKPRKLASTGYLHLAYFATEITLHRCIIRALHSTSNAPSYLVQVCRSAAKSRLLSAMEFCRRLKPEHLQSFWYFTSRLNFALVGTFGSLLWATASTVEEQNFFQARLAEYKWTLRVSTRGAEFLAFAVATLDTDEMLLKEAAKRSSLGISSTNGVAGVQGDDEDIEEEEEDAVDVELDNDYMDVSVGDNVSRSAGDEAEFGSYYDGRNAVMPAYDFTAGASWTGNAMFGQEGDEQ